MEKRKTTKTVTRKSTGYKERGTPNSGKPKIAYKRGGGSLDPGPDKEKK